jgi:hypothetical protein
VIGFHPQIVRDLLHRHGSDPRQKACKRAFMLGVEMLHQHEPHACIGRQMFQQLRERFQPASGSANANDGKVVWSPAFKPVGFGLELAARLLCLPGRHLGAETLNASPFSIRTLFLTIFRFHRSR